MRGWFQNRQKPGGPNSPSIPLHLARINADLLLTVRRSARTTVAIHSWIWASGSHGGPRLSHPTPGQIRLILLREECDYLHMVGDYPSYDLEFHSAWLPALLSAWKGARMSATDPLDRLVSLRLRAEFEVLTDKQSRENFLS